MKKSKVYNLVVTAVLAALVVVLQVFASGLKIGAVTFSFVMVPIVLGAIIVGEWAGLFLGGLFGLITLIAGITGADAFTNIYFTNSPIITILICMVKGLAAGFFPGLVYKLIKKKNDYVAAAVAAGVAPVINTGIFILISLLLKDVIAANFIGEGQSVLEFLVIGCAGINFIVEFITTVLIVPSIYIAYKKIRR